MKRPFWTKTKCIVAVAALVVITIVSVLLATLPSYSYEITTVEKLNSALASPTTGTGTGMTINLKNSNDFILLSRTNPDIYQNATIVVSLSAGESLDLSGTATYIGKAYSFQGFGSTTYPFKGSFSCDVPLPIPCQLFNALDVSANIGSLTLQRTTDTTTSPLFAAVIMGEGTRTYTLTHQPYQTVEQDGSSVAFNKKIAGVIGEIRTGTNVILNMTDTSTSQFSGKNATGYFCNTLSGTLTVNAFNRTDLNVKSDSGCAGSFIGEMKAGSTLTFNPGSAYSMTAALSAQENYYGGLVGKLTDATVNIQQSVTVNFSSTVSKFGGGGVVGLAENPAINFATGKTITISGRLYTNAISTDTDGLGGIFGKLIMTGNTTYTLDLTPYQLTSITFESTVKQYGVGGIIGVLNNESTTVNINIAHSIESSYTNGVGQSYGGVIGSYFAGERSATLAINGANNTVFAKVTAAATGSNSIQYVGGIIGRLTNVVDNGFAYVEVKNVIASIVNTNKAYQFGGIIGDMGEGNMLNLIGAVKVTNGNTTANIAGLDASYSSTPLIAGGIVGKMGYGVIRLSGTTDVSTFAPKATNSSFIYYGQILGRNDAGLVYAVGSGNSGDANWLFKRHIGDNTNDIGNYGQVIRLNSTAALTAAGFTENRGQGITSSGTALIGFSTDTHVVTVADSSAVRLAIDSARDFAAQAISLQCRGKTDSCLQIPSNSDLTFKFTGNVDLSGTGIIGLQRDNLDPIMYQNTTYENFGGIVRGENHTLTLSIGETYGVSADGSPVSNADQGAGQIYAYGNHAHYSIGLIANRGYGNVIENLTVDGIANIRIGRTEKADKNVYIGLIAKAGAPRTNASVSHVTSSVDFDIQYVSNDKELGGLVHCGGFIGYLETTPNKYVFSNCTWDGSFNLTDAGTVQRKSHSVGGFIGRTPTDVNVDFTDCTVKGEIISNRCDSDGKARYGGLIGEMGAASDVASVCNVTNVLFDGLTIDVTNDVKYMGGAFGYLWTFKEVNVTGVKLAGCTFTNHQTAPIGAVVFQANGIWKVQSNTNSAITHYGIEYAKSADGTANSLSCITNNSVSSLIVCRADTTLATSDYAMYLNIGQKPSDGTAQCAFKIQEGSVSVNLGSGTYFDEIAGVTFFSSSFHKNGIVSIELSDEYIDINGTCNTYQHQLGTDYQNTKTRYYYNLERYRDGNPIDATAITTSKQLLLYSVAVHGAEKIASHFATGYKNATVTGGTLDMTGLSYYPVDLPAGYVFSLNNATVRFSYKSMNNCESGNKLYSKNTKQHYFMQFGLFRNVTSATIEVNNATFSGNVGQNSSYSGFLICGTAQGAITNNVMSDSKLTINGLTFDGAVLSSYSTDNRALLVKAINNYSQTSISGVTTTGYTSSQYGKAAGSLLGTVGSEKDGCYISLAFDRMDLNGHVNESIFKYATFIYSFQYMDETTCSGQYTFVATDPVTYGKELSNTTSGRNQGLQYYYYRTTTPVSDGQVTANVGDGFNTSSFLRYVYEAENASNYRFELDINIAFVNLVTGCGISADPYQVDSGVLLETLATYLNNGAPANWIVCINQTVSADAATGTEAGTNHIYLILKNGEWYNCDYTSDALYTVGTQASQTHSFMRQYLANAYYRIVQNIELNQDGTYVGLGANANIDPSANPYNAFSGYLFGAKNNGDIPTVTIKAPSTSLSQFGGLVVFANGCVIKDLHIVYANNEDDGGIEIVSDSKPTNQLINSQVFFGGIIGYVVGGDNFIDNVTVDLSQTSVNVSGTYAHLANIGGYVGLVGGNSTSGAGGGVIFKNITGAGLTQINGVAIPSDRYYWNAYVGRVLDGFACAENQSINNSDKNYTIPLLTGSVSVAFSDFLYHTNDATAKTVPQIAISVENALEAWVVSALVNSGASAQDSTNVFLTNAYKYGRCWNADMTSSVWGGNNRANKQSYLALKYTDKPTPASMMSGGKTANKLVLLGNLDFTSIGNGFRGIGSTYSDFCLQSSPNKLNAVLYLWNRGMDGNSKTITMNLHVREYPDEMWAAQACGFFSVICPYDYYADSTSTRKVFKQVTISGVVSYDNGDIHNQTMCYVGGLGGVMLNVVQNDNKFKAPTFSEINLSSLTVAGGRYAGGMLGYLGQIYRISKSKSFNTYGFSLGYFYITDCSYMDLHVQALYAAGGLIGAGRSDDVFVNGSFSGMGKSDEDHSTITIVGDMPSEMRAQYDDTRYTNEYAGAGGLFGMMRCTLKMTVGSGKLIELKYVTVTGPRLQYNSDFGIGGIVGSIYENKSIELTRAKLSYIRVQTDMSQPFTSNNNTLYSQGYWVGGIGGYCRPVNYFKVILTDVSNIECLYGNSVAGFFGIAKNVTIDRCSLKDSFLFTQGIQNYQGPGRVAGLVGYHGDSVAFNVIDTVVEGNTLIGDGRVGGIVAETSGGLFHLTNFTFNRNVLATNAGPSDYYITSGNTNPPLTGKSEGQVNCTDQVGGLIGSIDHDNQALIGHNIQMSDNLLGYVLRTSGEFVTAKSGSGNTATLAFLTKDDAQSITWESDDRIALKNKVGNVITYTSYQDVIIGNATDYTDGRVGLIVGGGDSVNRVAYYQLQALSVSGLVPNQEVGGCQTNGQSYAVYTNCLQVQTNKPNGSKTPYMDVNPVTTVNGLSLSGDGASISAMETLLSDYASNYENSFHLVNRYANLFSSTGSYRNYVKRYSEEETALGSDFEILVLSDILNADTIIRSYIRMVTNSEWQAYTIELNTYQFTGSGYSQASKCSLFMNSAEKFAVTAGCYDNGLNQITVITLTYTTDGKTLKIDIPVLVKKVLQYSVYAAAIADTPYYASAFDQLTSVALTGYGEKITLRIQYLYDRSLAEWQVALEGGENFLSLMNNRKLTFAEGKYLPANTYMVLVDPNHASDSYFYQTAQQTNVLAFTDFAGWEDLALYERFDFNVTENEDGFFVVADELTGTVKVGDIYYRLATDADAELTHYELTISDFKTGTMEVDGETQLVDYYYVTFYIANGDHVANMLTVFSNEPLCSTLSTRKLNTIYHSSDGGAENRFIYTCEMFNQDLSLDDSSTIAEISDETTFEVIELQVQNTISLNDTEEARDIFNRFYSASTNLSYGMVIKANKYTDATTSTPFVITAGTNIRVEYTYSYEDENGQTVTGTYNVTYEVTTDSSSVLLDYPESIMGYIFASPSHEVDISATIRLEYNELGIFAQFPENSGTGSGSGAGLAYSVVGKLADRPTELRSSTIASSSCETDRHFYRTAKELAKMVYEAYNQADIISGDISQLGINANPKEGENESDLVTVTTAASYDVSATNVTDADKFSVKLVLYCKNNLGQYIEIENINDYLKNVEISYSGTPYSVQASSTTLIKLVGDSYKGVPIDFDVSFDVVTGATFEEMNGVYANYKVEITSDLFQTQGEEDVSLNYVADDYIIYSNVRINASIYQGD